MRHLGSFIPVAVKPWRRIGLHGAMECPECGMPCHDWKARRLHQGWHAWLDEQLTGERAGQMPEGIEKESEGDETDS